MDDFQLKGIVEEKFVKWEYNSSSATEKNSIAEENKAKADQPKDDTKKTETDNQSNAMKEKHGKVSFFLFLFLAFLSVRFVMPSIEAILIVD